MKDIVSQFAMQLTLEEKRELVAEPKGAIAEELASRACGPAGPSRCPRCGSPSFVRKGRGRDGGQRWLCRGCARTFSARTRGLLASSKLPASAWMSFAECMADALPLRETAARVGVSLYTAWFMRMRVCEVMALRTPDCRPGTFHVDGTLVMGSLKGNLGRSGILGLPRPRHRNGRDGRRASRGRSKEWVVVECGVNELGDCFCDVCGRGSAGAGELSVELAARIPAGSAVVTDGHKSYGFAARGYRHAEVDAGDPSSGDINMVNALHSRLKAFLRRFNGVSTRRLQRYLDWFRYAEAFKGGGMDGRERLFMHEAEGRYWKTRRLTHLECGDAMVYWTRQIADMSTVV